MYALPLKGESLMAEDIFDLSISGKDKEFVKTALQLEGEVASDILTVLGEFPYFGSLIKLGRIGANYMDLLFIRKIARFLQQSENIEEEKKAQFLEKLDRMQRKKMYDYLIHFLHSAESEDKADVMGIIYGERICGHIDDNLFLRLCSVVNNCYIEDLKHLGAYLELNDKNDYVTDNLRSCGLLTIPSPSFEGDSINLESRYTLSNIGKTLYDILKHANWL